VASQVVDRFLGSRGQAQPACAGSAACPCSQPQRAPEPPRPAEPPKPKVEIVPFVCENDVRMAVQRSQKIYIGTKTIVTPAARDLGEQHGILVMAQP
jgi:hypothetical protein